MAFIGKGAILQMKQTVLRSALSASTGKGSFSAFDSNFYVNITPTSTASLIVIGGHLCGATSGGDQGVKIVYRRDSSTLTTVLDGSGVNTVTGVTSGNIGGATSAGNIASHGAESFPLCFIDKPNTTNQVSYSIALGHTSSVTRTVYVNQLNGETNSDQWSRMVSIIYAMEVGQ